MILFEQPIVARADDPESQELARLMARIEQWIVSALGSNTPPQGALVLGLYGGRGTGKTSALLTLFARLRDRGNFVVPNVAPDTPVMAQQHAALFRPAETRDHDDLLFLLLRHLETYPSNDGSRPEQIDTIRGLEVRRKEYRYFFDYIKEISASRDDLEDRFVKLHIDVADGTQKLRGAFGKLIGCLRDDGLGRLRGPLLLLIDDLDLQPHRALETLEHLYLFLNHPGVVAVVAADKDLLLESIAHTLEKRLAHALEKSAGNLRYLAGALLAKYVPHSWHLPVPVEDRRLALLWEGWNELPHWWSDEAVRCARQARADQPLRRDIAAIAEILPPTYRGLKAMHNRLLSLREELRCEPETAVVLSGETGKPLAVGLGVARRLVPALLSALVAFDVQFPDVGLLSLALARPGKIKDLLASLAPRAPSESNDDQRQQRLRAMVPAEVMVWFQTIASMSRTDEGDEESEALAAWSPLDRLDRADYTEERREEAEGLVEKIAALWSEFVEAGTAAPGERRFLAVSHHADALAMARPVWVNEYDPAEVWHIDVQAYGNELGAARAAAAAQIRKLGVTSFAGRVLLHVKASLALVLWLGWELRYLHAIEGLNLLHGATMFPGPTQGLDARGTFQIMEAETVNPVSERSLDAIIIIDLLRLSKPEQVGRFLDKDGQPVVCSQRWRLLGPGNIIQPGDLVALLEDMIELIERLRSSGVERFHLGFVGPDVIAFFLGQQLNARGSFLLYTWSQSRNRYEFAFSLQENHSA
jgi:SMODS-associated and fused to various effectors sensor domain/KAP family P-loop domain